MNFIMICFMDESFSLQSICCTSKKSNHSIYEHCNTLIGENIFSILHSLPQKIEEGYFSFQNKFHWFKFFDKTEKGRILLLSDLPVKMEFHKTLFSELFEGVQYFNQSSTLFYINKSCEKIEDRCGIFQNKNKDKLYSINSGFPVFAGDNFLGAVGIVYNRSVFERITEKKDRIVHYLNHNSAQNAIAINQHEENGYHTFEDIIGQAPILLKTIQLTKKMAQKDISILLHGETGTGKELFAQSIHMESERKNKPFMSINCAALPPTIIESILFGTTKGAYTGSVDKIGLLEEAQGGSFFLDELNSMDIELQAKLLRVIQEKEFRRLGGTKIIHCDIRFISAMNEEPEEAINNRHIREDLYYRLAGASIEIPPLRDRKEDIYPLMHEYLHHLSERYHKIISGVSKEVEDIFWHYNWPGNIRELFHILEYAFVLSENAIIERVSMPQKLLKTKNTSQIPLPTRSFESIAPLHQQLEEKEKQVILSALNQTQNNISRAAKILGIQRQNLQYRIKKLNLYIERKN